MSSNVRRIQARQGDGGQPSRLRITLAVWGDGRQPVRRPPGTQPGRPNRVTRSFSCECGSELRVALEYWSTRIQRLLSRRAATDLRTSGGRLLGRVEITIQDVIGFIKLAYRHDGAECADQRRDPQRDIEHARGWRGARPSGENATTSRPPGGVASIQALREDRANDLLGPLVPDPRLHRRAAQRLAAYGALRAVRAVARGGHAARARTAYEHSPGDRTGASDGFAPSQTMRSCSPA